MKGRMPKTLAPWIVAVAAAAIVSIQPAAAQKVRLFFTSMSPAGSSNSEFFNAWAKRVNDAAKGAIDVQVKDGVTLANFANVYDRVLDDVVQIGWGQQAFIRGRFPASDVVGLPFVAEDHVAGAVAFWRLYKTGMLDSEYKQVVPLWLGLLDASTIHLVKAPESLDNLHGLKIRVNGQVASEVVTRLGGTPISLPASNMYEGLQRGTIDGVDTGWGAFEPYRLYEVTSYHVDDPIGTAPCMFFMLRTKFDALPEVARKALMDNGREPETRAFAQHNGSMGQRMKQKTESLPNQKIVKLPPQQLADWKTRTEPVVANWEKAHPQGEKLVAMYRKLYAEVKAGQ